MESALVTIDVPACMALGAVVALKNADTLANNPAPARFKALGVCLFGFTPLAHLFELYFHDWEWQYLPTAPWMSMAFIIVMNGLGLLSFEWARKLIVAGNKKGAQVLLGVALACVALYYVVFYKRVMWVGTKDEWLAG